MRRLRLKIQINLRQLYVYNIFRKCMINCWIAVCIIPSQNVLKIQDLVTLIRLEIITVFIKHFKVCFEKK